LFSVKGLRRFVYFFCKATWHACNLHNFHKCTMSCHECAHVSNSMCHVSAYDKKRDKLPMFNILSCASVVIAHFRASHAGMPLALQGDTPLHAAAQHAGPPLLKMLLDKGCNPLAENLLVSYVALLKSVLGSELLPKFSTVSGLAAT